MSRSMVPMTADDDDDCETHDRTRWWTMRQAERTGNVWTNVMHTSRNTRSASHDAVQLTNFTAKLCRCRSPSPSPSHPTRDPFPLNLVLPLLRIRADLSNAVNVPIEIRTGAAASMRYATHVLARVEQLSRDHTIDIIRIDRAHKTTDLEMT